MIEAGPKGDETQVPVPQKPSPLEKAGITAALWFEKYLDRLPNKEKSPVKSEPQVYSPIKRLGLALAGLAVVATITIGGIGFLSHSQKVNEGTPTPATTSQKSYDLLRGSDRLGCEGRICNFLITPDYSLAVMVNGLEIYHRSRLVAQALEKLHLMAANERNYPMIFITGESFKNDPQALKSQQLRLNQQAFEANFFVQANQVANKRYDVFPPRPVSFSDLVSYTGFQGDNKLDILRMKDQRLRRDLNRQLSIWLFNEYKKGKTNIELTNEFVLTTQEVEDISTLLPISIDP